MAKISEDGLFCKLQAVFFWVMVVILAVASIVFFVVVAFHYNHWVGSYGRTAFWFITVVLAAMIITCYVQISKDDPEKLECLKCYWILGVIAVLFCAEVTLAGLTISPWTVCGDVSSGKLMSQHGVHWDNPFARTVVIVRKPCEVSVDTPFDGRKVVVIPSSGPKLGTPADVLLGVGYIGSGSSVDDAGMKTIVTVATHRAILQLDLKPEALPRNVSQDKLSEFLVLVRKNVNSSLPSYMKRDATVRFDGSSE